MKELQPISHQKKYFSNNKKNKNYFIVKLTKKQLT